MKDTVLFVRLARNGKALLQVRDNEVVIPYRLVETTSAADLERIFETIRLNDLTARLLP